MSEKKEIIVVRDPSSPSEVTMKANYPVKIIKKRVKG